MSVARVQEVVRGFLAAVEARDAAAAAGWCSPDATYRNVPHEPEVGREAIRALLARILDHSQHVRWEIVTEAWTDRRAHLERVDRFTIDGREYAIECHGVWEVDVDAGLVTAVRDYVDIGVWRGRIGDVLS